MDFSQIKELDRKYSMITYPRHNLCLSRGEGSYLYDTNNHAYLDLVAGLGENCLGYKHPMLTEAIKDQVDKLISCSNLYYNELQSQLAKTICETTAFTKACFCGSICDTLLIAATMVRKYCAMAKDSRRTILVVTDAKGARYDAMQNNNLDIRTVRPDENEFKKALDSDVCAVVFAPIQVERGVKLSKYEFILSSYALCKAHGTLIIYDETGIGLGRTGTMFAFEQYGIQPDIVMIARGMGGGVQIAAVLSRGEISTTLAPTDRISAFRISTIACTAALVVIDSLRSGLLEEVEAKGEYLMSKLSKFKKHNFVADIRGKGLMAGIELTPNLKAAKVIGQMESEGFLLDQTDFNTLRITPPFTITESEIDSMYNALAQIFAETNL
ncbi:MAG: aminotransferase class III-fold pyridoxal phosphate-dependent enzyme [Clostridiales bacterium]|nr:aminotransferase class III-fold pyridoxal phosphate-dependent enzyme [Clostridiales bacterium]